MTRLPGGLIVLSVLALLAAAACGNPAASDAPNLVLPPAPALNAVASPSATASPAAATGLQQVKQMLIYSADQHGINPYLVMAVAWWESGWDQNQVSSTGAIGIMQVEPDTAASAGPLLLHRAANIHDPADNIELGVVILKEDLDRFHNDLAKALIAYYAGPAAVTDWSHEDAASQRYVLGVYRLAIAFSNGTGPA